MKSTWILILGFAALSALAQSGTTTPPSHHGVLHTGILGLGGETTGVVLEYNDSQGKKQKIEVEINAQTVGANFSKDGAFVTVNGDTVIHHYLERGDVPRIVATEIKPDKIVE